MFVESSNRVSEKVGQLNFSFIKKHNQHICKHDIFLSCPLQRAEDLTTDKVKDSSLSERVGRREA